MVSFGSARKIVVALAIPLLVLSFPPTALAKHIDCTALPGEAQGFEDIATLQGLECIFENAVSAILFLAGIVLFVMFLVGGFKFITAGGDPKAVEAAKGTLTHAIAGLVLLILAFLIIRFIANITGVEDITRFRIRR